MKGPLERIALGLVPGGLVVPLPNEIRIPPESQEFWSLHASIAAVTRGTAGKVTEGKSEGLEVNDGPEEVPGVNAFVGAEDLDKVIGSEDGSLSKLRLELGV